MVIGSGDAKGMRLLVPKGLATRPTSAKVRAAILNSLQSDLEGSRVLDLFAGSGALGLEAISRGATNAVFVESAQAGVRALKENVAGLQARLLKQNLAPRSIEVRACDVKAYLLQSDGIEKFHIIFADPPYREAGEWFAIFLECIPKFLCVGGFLVMECASEMLEDLTGSIGANAALEVVKTKNYGDTGILILCYNSDLSS